MGESGMFWGCTWSMPWCEPDWEGVPVRLISPFREAKRRCPDTEAGETGLLLLCRVDVVECTELLSFVSAHYPKCPATDHERSHGGLSVLGGWFGWGGSAGVHRPQGRRSAVRGCERAGRHGQFERLALTRHPLLSLLLPLRRVRFRGGFAFAHASPERTARRHGPGHVDQCWRQQRAAGVDVRLGQHFAPEPLLKKRTDSGSKSPRSLQSPEPCFLSYSRYLKPEESPLPKSFMQSWYICLATPDALENTLPDPLGYSINIFSS